MAAIELHADAERELLEAARWYDDRRPGLGDEFTAEVGRCLLLIATAPERWPFHQRRSVANRQVRQYVMQNFPYALPYLVGNESVFILAIAHTSRRPTYWRKRVLSAK